MRLIINRNRSSEPNPKDAGSALAGVLAVFGITILLASLAASSTVNGLGFTSATRAGVQSQAAAEAGISFALARMTDRKCSVKYTSSDVVGVGAAAGKLNFNVEVFSRSTPDDVWGTSRCPAAGDNFVRFVSTGNPQVDGVPFSRGDSRSVEAIYNWSPAYIETNLQVSGPAIYSATGGQFRGSSQLKNPDKHPAVIQIANGDAQCAESAIYEGDVVVAKGGWGTGGSCQIFGNIWALDDMTTAQSSIVWGTVWASKLDMGQSSQIKGDAYITGNTDMIETSAIVKHLLTGSRSGPGVPGSQTIDSSLIGTKPSFPDGLEAVPEWTDFDFDLKDWPGFSYQALGTPCNAARMQGAVNIMSTTQPGPSILDLRLCGEGAIKWDATIVLPNDLVILAPSKFVISGGGPAISDSGVARRLWIIQPDDVKDRAPTCDAGNYMNLGESYVVHATVSTMVYTPCYLTLGHSAVWRGQFYAGGVTISHSASLSYVPGGLPGVNLSDGTYAPDAGPGSTGIFVSKMGARISIRDLDASN